MAARSSLLLGKPPLRVSRNQTRHLTATAGFSSISTLMSRRHSSRVHHIFHAMIISLPSWTELIRVRFICLSTWILESPIDVRHLMNRLATVEGFTVDPGTLVLGLCGCAERWELVAVRIGSRITALVNSGRAKCPELLIWEISTLTAFMNKTSGILFFRLWAKAYELLTQNLDIILQLLPKSIHPIQPIVPPLIFVAIIISGPVLSSLDVCDLARRHLVGVG